MKNLIRLLPVLVIATSLGVLTGCAGFKPIARTVVEIAHDICVQQYSEEKPTMTPEEIARSICNTEEAIKPFLDALLAAKQQLRKPASAAPAVSETPVAPVVLPKPVVAPVPVPTPSTKPAVTPAPAPAPSAKK